MPQISKRVRDAWRAALSSDFNALVAQVAPDYSVAPFTFDFAGAPRSNQFFLGQLDAADITGTSTYKFPLISLYGVASANQHKQKPTQFSGVVRMGMDVWLSFRGGNALQDFESTADVVEDVVNTIADRMGKAGWIISVGMDRGPVKPGAENWIQLLRFTLQFELHF